MRRTTVKIGLKSGRELTLWDCVELTVKYDREDGCVTSLDWNCKAPWWKLPLRWLGLSRLNRPLFVSLNQITYIREKM